VHPLISAGGACKVTTATSERKKIRAKEKEPEEIPESCVSTVALKLGKGKWDYSKNKQDFSKK